MVHFKTFFVFILALFLSACQQNGKLVLDERTPVQCVDPFIGTGGHGHTYPGATRPFGMVQLSPDTRLTGWDGCSAYHYTDSLIYGFSHTHLSGTGVPDYADILFMPTGTGSIFSNGMDGGPGYRARFLKETEHASPGFYKVRLEDYKIDVALTATERAGFHQYSYKNTAQAWIMVDLAHRDEVIESGLQWVSPTEIVGYRISRGWARRQHVYFVAQFSRPITEVNLNQAGSLQPSEGMVTGQNLVAALAVDLPQDGNILVKVGISAVDVEGARKNLLSEIPDWDFAQARNAAQVAWEKQLSKVEIEASPEVREIFYTALYHNSLAPNVFQDVDGRYRGVDGEVHQSDSHTQHTVFSLWDTYRATHPWFTIFERERTVDLIETMLAQFDQRGELPVWELAGNETWCMIGYHSVSVIADAWAKGIRQFDPARALTAMVSSAENARFNKPAYESLGFLPSDVEHESVSKTLEYAYDDWCIASMAESMGEHEIADRFYRRAQSYKNLYDPETGYMRAKKGNTWVEPFDPAEVNFHYTEANSWQYSFYMPQDVEGWIQLVGGRERMIDKLDALFQADSETKGREQVDISGLIGQYAHGNEPSHHMAYLYAFAGEPWKGQERVHQIMNELYTTEPDGLSGNEDCGQMSAWYTFSALGFYPVTPGIPVYTIGSPRVRAAQLKLENGHTFSIEVEGEGIYIQSMQLNGKPYEKMFIHHDTLMAGGNLLFRMGSAPNKALGVDAATRPSTSINQSLVTPLPGIQCARPAFFVTDTIRLNHPLPGVELYYTLDGTEPVPSQATRYEKPVIINQTTEIRALAVHPEWGRSRVVAATFEKIPEKRHLELANAYSPQYPGGGEVALIDYIQGGNDYRTGEWQGYHGVDLDATVDLGELRRIRKVGIRFLQDENAWIFLPTGVRFFASVDGVTYRELPRQTHEISPFREGTIIHEFLTKEVGEARYLHLIAENRGICPEGHKGAGGTSWIFADEIMIDAD